MVTAKKNPGCTREEWKEIQTHCCKRTIIKTRRNAEGEAEWMEQSSYKTKRNQKIKVISPDI
jgi:hypothetical protein